ncbi:MAG: DUF3024 domain-containing protein [Aeromicrobium erythreum]
MTDRPTEAELALVAAACERWTHAEHADVSRVEHEVDGSDVTIVEASRFATDGEWLRVPAALLRRTGDGTWTLFCFDVDGQPGLFDEVEPGRPLAELLEVVAADPTDVFWG